MPVISSDCLTVLNLFTTDTPGKQDQILGAMREIVDAATYEGWMSSTVHSGQDRLGTANFIQWRSRDDLERRYDGEEFKHRTMPEFTEMTTSIRLLQTEAVYFQQRSDDGAPQISPDRGDYTVIDVYGVTAADQDELVTALGPSRDWLREVPGYRSHTVLRGLRARGVEGLFVAVYSQWDDKASFDAYVETAEDGQPEARRKNQADLDRLVTSHDWNTYRVIHTRSAGDPVPVADGRPVG